MSYLPYRSAKNPGYGPVRNALDVKIAPRGEGDISSTCLSRRLRLAETNSRMRRFRAVPVARRAWYVTLTVLKASRADFAEGRLVKGLQFQAQAFWVHSKRLARSWLQRDRGAGSTACAMFPVEYRICTVCERILLGQEAQAYRMKQRRPFGKWEFKQGPACGVECRPKPVLRRRAA